MLMITFLRERSLSSSVYFHSEMRYFLQRLITRGDYESAVILAKNNEAWLPSELLNEDDLSPHSLIQYRLVKANKV